MTNTNPLLDFADLPLFDQVKPEHVPPAIRQLLDDADRALTRVTADSFPATWADMAAALDVHTERLSRAWGVVSHLQGVADTPELRAAYNEMLPVVTEFWTRLGADERLYAKYKVIAPDSLNAEQTKARSDALKGFVLGGAELQGEAKTRFAALQEELAALSQKFSENSLDATDKFAHFASTGELTGVPQDVLDATAAAAKVDGKDGHKLTLKLPTYLPVMQFADNRALRERLYRAYVTRGSDQAEGELKQYDNSQLIQQIVALRAEEAALLGYKNFAEVSLATKMANTPTQVIAFLRELAAKAKPYAERDLTDLRAFAKDDLGWTHEVQPWDVPYLSEKLKEARYAYSEQAVKQYFTAPKVLAGLFKIVETLFDVQIRADQAPVWNDGVSFYRIERVTPASASTPQHTRLIGQFYLDPTAREGKRGGAWMDDVRCRWLRPDTQAVQTPVAHLVCNFAAPVGDKPALLTHDDVITLFHEFGHGLHHMLTQVNERDVSGINGVEWDAVELPSQFMENFCWEWPVIRHMTAHVDTCEPLPKELFDKMLAAKNYQAGMLTVRQIEFGLFDMLLHTADAAAGRQVEPLLAQVRSEVAVVVPPAWARSMHTFGHIFSGGYAAGYYSYKWAEVLSADAYAAFEETMQPDGTPSLETGKRYRESILEAGGSRPAMESFKAFRGREPSLDALLRHQGMA